MFASWSFKRINATLVMNHNNAVNTFKPTPQIRNRKTLGHCVVFHFSLLLDPQRNPSAQSLGFSHTCVPLHNGGGRCKKGILLLVVFRNLIFFTYCITKIYPHCVYRICFHCIVWTYWNFKSVFLLTNVQVFFFSSFFLLPLWAMLPRTFLSVTCCICARIL